MTASKKSVKPAAKLSMSIATGKIAVKQPPKGLAPKDAKMEAKRAAAKAVIAKAAKGATFPTAGKPVVDHGPSNKAIAKLMDDSKQAQALVEADRAAEKLGLPSIANMPVKHKPALALDNDLTPAVVCRRVGQSYTCIRLQIGERFTHFITMEKLTLEKQENRAFHEEWAEFTDYPVRRAAELYLNAECRQIESQARTHLESIVKNPLTVYNLEPSTVTPKEITMATAKKTAAAAPATPVKGQKNAPTPANKMAGPAANKMSPAAAKAATPAKTAPAAKSAPAKNGIATVVSGAKPPAKNAPAAKSAAPGFAARDTGTYKVVPAPADKPRRGNTLANMTVLEDLQKKLKGKFTKAQAIEALTPFVGVDEAKSVFADGKYRKLIVEA